MIFRSHEIEGELGVKPTILTGWDCAMDHDDPTLDKYYVGRGEKLPIYG
jgi:hypothetical protein